jgi:moderate conductance mechanosensitive channel
VNQLLPKNFGNPHALFAAKFAAEAPRARVREWYNPAPPYLMTDSLRRWMEFAGVRAVRILAIIFVALVVARLLKALTDRLIQLAKSQSRVAQMREQQTRTMAALLYSVGLGLIVAIAILTALPEFGFNVSPVEAAAAVASLALGFGAQSLVKDLINGFFIVFEDQFVIGDLIQTNGETGRVEHLTLRRTVLRNLTGAMVTIPNSLVGPVANLSRDWSQVFVDISVPSEEMVGRALTALEKIAADFRDDADWSPALVDGPRVLGVESLSLEGIVIRLQVRTVLNRKDDVARELRRRIKLGFEQSHIQLSQMYNVSVREIPPSNS